ncbi:MAG: hypothetical protein KC414_14495, partial [Romboutsia sp.]|nr:hypothetical protein [Romboutsia sp.]
KDVEINELRFTTLSDDIASILDNNITFNEDIISDLQDKYKNRLSVNDIEMTLYSVLINRRVNTINNEIIAIPPEINQELFNIINNLRTLFVSNTYISVTDLTNNAAAWKQAYDNKLQNDCSTLCGIITLQDRLYQYYNVINNEVMVGSPDALSTSPITYLRLTLEMNPKFNGLVPTPDDGIDIFDDSRLSDYVPYIRYNRSRKLDKGDTNETSTHIDYYKVWSGDVPDQIPDYSSIINRYHKKSKKSKKKKNIDTTDRLLKSNKPDVIYLTVWSGEDNVSRATKKSYVEAKYDLTTNILKVQSPIEQDFDETRVLNRVLESLNLTVESTQEVQVVGEFNIYGLTYNENTLYDAILNDDLFNNYLYVDEKDKPFSTKTRMNIHFRSIATYEDEEEKTGQASSVKVKLEPM